MTDRTRSELDDMALSVLQRLNRLCNDFEAGCRGPDTPEIEPYLQQIDVESRPTLLRQLIPLHIECRRRNGDDPQVSEYVRRFPDVEVEWLQRALDGELDRTDAGPQADGGQPRGELIEPGTIVGNYEIVAHVGAGGMADVYRARHHRLRRDVALKHLKDLGRNAHQHFQRFEKEMILVAGLSHPNLVTAYDASEFLDRPFLVTEFVEGTDLGQRVRRDGHLAVAAAVDCMLQAARGLDYVHQRGVVHRDVKPSNLLLDNEGCVKVSDLGLARFTQPTPEIDDIPADRTSTEVVMGTVDYMAPEQGRSATFANEQSDIYSLGCTLFYLLTGRPVYPGGSLIDRLHAHRFTDAPNLCEIRGDVPSGLNDVFQKMIAKEPRQRYASMADVVDALEALRSLEPAPDGDDDFSDVGAFPSLDAASEIDSAALRTMAMSDPPTVKRRSAAKKPTSRQRQQRRTWIAVTVAGAALALVVLVAFLTGGNTPSPDSDDDANGATNGTPPPVAVIPFNNAQEHQQAWSAFLKTPRELTERGITFSLIPAGRFQPGSTEEQLRTLRNAGQGNVDQYGFEALQPEVALKPFYISTTEITMAMFRRFADATGYRTDAEKSNTGYGLVGRMWRRGPYSWKNMGEQKLGDRLPATNISWNDAKAYCEWLTKQTGGKTIYRLPTEHEWEFAARGGTNTIWFFGDDYTRLELYAWCGSNANGRLHDVAGLRPNPFGLFDVYGNESEWCSNRYLRTEAGSFIRLTDDDTNQRERVYSPQRGGNFFDNGIDARSAVKRLSNPAAPKRGAFRIVREIPQ